jgi:DNA-binding NarL/FixJ family response regulator
MGPTVLIVDDHAEFRAAARRLLEAEGVDVVGEAADGFEALVLIARLRPDLVLLDLQLPEKDGFEVARELRRMADPPAVVMISSRPAGVYGDRLDQVDALGFLAKHELSAEALRRLLA